MGEERVLGYADGFKIGWDKAIELVESKINDFCFAADTDENIEIKRDLYKSIKFANVLGDVE